MAASSYDQALRRLLVHEGGYTNHPADPGGPTNFGITIADARKYGSEFGWIASPTAADMKAMPVAFAKSVYRAKYWHALRCDDLPAGVDYAVFDFGVNSGIARSGKMLRRALGLPADAWAVSGAVVAAARAGDPHALIAAICRQRMTFLRGLKTFPVFGAGWSRRVAEVEAAALLLAGPKRTGAESAAPNATAAAENAPDKGIVPVNRGAQKTATGAVIVTGAGAAHGAHQAGVSPVVVAATLVLAAGCWFAWRWHRRRPAPIHGDTT